MTIVPTSGAVIATDGTNDVTKLTWTSATVWTALYSQSKPEIDIQTIDYSPTSITIAVSGSPVMSAGTFYWITLTDTADSMTLFLWAGGFTGYSVDQPAAMTYTKGTITNTTILSPTLGTHTITWTIPTTVQYFDMDNPPTFFSDHDLNLPTTPPATWMWQAWAWVGVDYSVQSGDWWVDFYPDAFIDTYYPGAYTTTVPTTTTTTAAATTTTTAAATTTTTAAATPTTTTPATSAPEKTTTTTPAVGTSGFGIAILLATIPIFVIIKRKR